MKRKDLIKLREKKVEELEKQTKELKLKIADLRIQLAAGKLKDVKNLKKARRDIAQIKTIIGEKKISRNP